MCVCGGGGGEGGCYDKKNAHFALLNNTYSAGPDRMYPEDKRSSERAGESTLFMHVLPMDSIRPLVQQ